MQFFHLKSARWALLALIPAAAILLCLFLPRKIAVSDELMKRVTLPPAPWGYVIVRDMDEKTENAYARRGRLALTIRETDTLSPTDACVSPDNAPPSTGGIVRSYLFARDRLVTVTTDGKTTRKPLSSLGHGRAHCVCLDVECHRPRLSPFYQPCRDMPLHIGQYP